jgi:uncharacterized surface protein with fasciclin (FAS1) repeats
MTKTLFLNASRRTLLAAALVATMSGCATGPAPGNVAYILENTPSLSTLNSLVAKAGLTNTLETGGPFTVFAPSNDAFKAVPAKTMDELAKDPEKLKAVLTYHIISGKVMAAGVKNSSVKTLNGASIGLGKAGDFVTVEGGLVTQADMATNNGVVHVIDSVLLPPVKK